MIKLVKYSENFTANCVHCGSGINCYAVMMYKPKILQSVSCTLCATCLKELYTAIPKEVLK